MTANKWFILLIGFDICLCVYLYFKIKKSDDNDS